MTELQSICKTAQSMHGAAARIDGAQRGVHWLAIALNQRLRADPPGH
jgi:hypothetical protein